MKALLKEIQTCSLCKAFLPVPPNPIVTADPDSKIVLISQAPGRIAFEKSEPWKDPGGQRLRRWLDVSETVFFNPKNFAIVPMAFCYPGKAKTGDLPPPAICAPTWHSKLLTQFNDPKLYILIGKFAQDYYLKDKKTLTERVRNFSERDPLYAPLPHPSPTNRFWIAKNSWFETDIIPLLQKQIQEILKC